MESLILVAYELNAVLTGSYSLKIVPWVVSSL